MRAKLLPAAVLAVVVFGGSYVRVAGLGREDFTNDELLHYYAAEGMRSGEGPVLPSGNLYDRAVDYTRLVRVALAFDVRPELAVRLPAAVFGVLSLAACGVLAWILGGPWAAVWGTFFFAIHPETMEQAHHGRFYSYQVFFGLIAVLAAWQVVRGVGERTEPTWATVQRRWGWSALAIVAFAAAARVQPTTYTVLAAWGLAIAVGAAADLRWRGRGAWVRSVPIHLIGLAVALLIVSTVFTPGRWVRLLALAGDVPGWAIAAQQTATQYYYWELFDEYPALIALGPLVFLTVALRHTRVAWFLAAWFGVPLALHSFVFPWKGERFVLLALPGFFLAGGIAVAEGLGLLRRTLNRAWRGWGLPYPAAAAVAAVAIVSAWGIETTPAFHTARHHPNRLGRDRWSYAAALLDAHPRGGSLPVGASYPLACLYYCGRVDFSVSGTAGGKTPPGPFEHYSGAPFALQADTVKARYGDAGAVFIAVDDWRWNLGIVSDDLQARLRSEAEELCAGRCGTMQLFYWNFGDTLGLDHPTAHDPNTGGP